MFFQNEFFTSSFRLKLSFKFEFCASFERFKATRYESILNHSNLNEIYRIVLCKYPRRLKYPLKMFEKVLSKQIFLEKIRSKIYKININWETTHSLYLGSLPIFRRILSFLTQSFFSELHLNPPEKKERIKIKPQQTSQKFNDGIQFEEILVILLEKGYRGIYENTCIIFTYLVLCNFLRLK